MITAINNWIVAIEDRIDFYFAPTAKRHYVLSEVLGKEHPETIQALKELNEEYRASVKQECEFTFKLLAGRRKYDLWKWATLRTPEVALQVADDVCAAMKVRKINGIQPNDRKEFAAASYDAGTQRISADFPIHLEMFLHEITHHVQSHTDFWEPWRKPHGKKFCEIEMKVFDCFLKGKSNG